MKYFSMFSGIGGFEVGIQKAIPWAKCLGFSEIDKYAISIYKKHFKNHKNYGNATKIKTKEDNEAISDAQRYKCCGNSITTNVVEIIFNDVKNNLFTKKKLQNMMTPNIVSFSGGRTSGMMLLQLLENGDMQQWRGDCVVFNNTSAEHKATYIFVSKIKKIVEEKYNIPFFITEFCTYEVKTNRGHTRRITYRLANDLPYCKDNNPNGYRFNGEIFEESISQSGTLPSAYQRTCTINMKILTTNNFLTDWLSHKDCIEQQGEVCKYSNISDKDIVKRHRMFNGELSDFEIIDKKTFVKNCQTFRPKQYFKDYTKASVNYDNDYLKSKIIDGNITLFGKNAVQYNSYIGIRFDEKKRAIKIRKRIKDAKLNLVRKKKKSSSIRTQPPLEVAKMPMIKARIDKEKVISFWQSPSRSKYDLDLPYDGSLSNCIYCPLKGKSKNQLIAKRLNKSNVSINSPSSLSWWANIENKYSRKVIKSSKNNYTNIGFFGASKDYVYQNWLNELEYKNEDALGKTAKNDSWNMDCNCTD